MRILFSPIGTADPMTGLGDGPMLNIVRNYQPEEVVLFLSPDMTSNEKRDHLYTEAIKLLCATTGQTLPSIKCINSPRPDVHRFDAYIADFEKELASIRKEHSDDEILVNVSSGTSAMEQALVALGAFGDYRLTLLQVSTPRHGMNRRGDREDPGELTLALLHEFWECNPDNEEDTPQDRIEEITLPVFRDRILKRNVIALLDAYDYEAALVLAKQCNSLPKKAIEEMERAARQLNLGGSRGDYKDKVKEAIWVLEVRMKQKRWADYVRALTPVLTWTAVSVLACNGLSESQYLKNLNGQKPGKLDWYAIEGNRRLMKVLNPPAGRARERYITNWMLDDLVREYCPADIARQIHLVRHFEEENRNDLAHSLVAADKKEIEARGGATFKEITRTLIELNGIHPGKYRKLNNYIKGLL